MLHAMRHAPLTRRSDGLTEALMSDANRENPMQELYEQLAAEGEDELHWEVFLKAFEKKVEENDSQDVPCRATFGLSEELIAQQQHAAVGSRAARRRSTFQLDPMGNHMLDGEGKPMRRRVSTAERRTSFSLIQIAEKEPDPEAAAILSKRKMKRTRFPEDIRGAEPRVGPRLGSHSPGRSGDVSPFRPPSQHGGDDPASYVTDRGDPKHNPYHGTGQDGPFLTQGLGTGAGYAFLDTTPHRRQPPTPKPLHPERRILTTPLVPSPPSQRRGSAPGGHRVSLASLVSASELPSDEGDPEVPATPREAPPDHEALRVKRWHGGEDHVTEPRFKYGLQESAKYKLPTQKPRIWHGC